MPITRLRHPTRQNESEPVPPPANTLRTPMSIDAGMLDIGADSTRFVPGDTDSLLRSYLTMVRRTRDQRRAASITLRREDIELIAEHLGQSSAMVLGTVGRSDGLDANPADGDADTAGDGRDVDRRHRIGRQQRRHARPAAPLAKPGRMSPSKSSSSIRPAGWCRRHRRPPRASSPCRPLDAKSGLGLEARRSRSPKRRSLPPCRR